MSKMEKIIEDMAGYVCEGLCIYNDVTLVDQDGLDDICVKCKMGEHIRNILDEYESVKRGGRESPLNWPDRMMDRFMQVN